MTEYQMLRKELEKYPIHTQEEEYALAERIKEGDRKAIGELALGASLYALDIARNYAFGFLSLRDLMNEAYFGLQEAAENYDPSKGVRFCTYATMWIKKYILKALTAHSTTMKVSKNDMALYSKIWKAYDKFLTEYGYAPSDEDLAYKCDTKVSCVAKALALRMRTVQPDDWRIAGNSIKDNYEDCYYSGDCNNFSEEWGGESVYDGFSPDVKLEHEEMSNQLSKQLSLLKDREREILTAIYGLGYTDKFSVEEIAKAEGVCTETIRQIRNKALQSLKRRLAPYRYAA